MIYTTSRQCSNNVALTRLQKHNKDILLMRKWTAVVCIECYLCVKVGEYEYIIKFTYVVQQKPIKVVVIYR